MYVYKITNIINNKCYIGITNDYETRWRLHKQTSVNPNHAEYNKVLYRAFRKYGLENFTFEIILSNLTVETAKEQEILLIEDLESLSSLNGYNVTKGGDFTEGQLKGEQCPNAKLTDAQVLDIINRREQGYLQKDVYKDYYMIVMFSTFQDIWSGRRWKHLQPTTINKCNGNRYLTDDVVRTIRTLKGTKSYKLLGEDYGVPASTISNIINNKTYKNVI